ncbi:lytic polysaccharide monooxygenase [Micromonospora sp. WMMA1923]|uniref:lytic polysaccharide monooxygenase n=1 Tax=Micromonospora sp. WMMA1923 TaxID=3404125 RepID=UPI003B95E741
MNRRRTALIATGLGGLPVLLTLTLTGQAGAHGSMQSPASRTYTCFLEGAESPDSAACRAAIATGGTQAVYDWHEVNIANAAGNHRQLIPDGRLCSANRDKYRGFDLTRADWPATALPSGGTWSFAYRATAAHRGTFQLYLTRTGYDPTRPLRWADLELFHTATDPTLSDGAYRMTARLPQRAGRHLVYSIWQRSDSPEAFYTCSDVTFGGTPPPTPPPPTTTPPTSPPPPTTAPPTFPPPPTTAPPTTAPPTFPPSPTTAPPPTSTAPPTFPPSPTTAPPPGPSTWRANVAYAVDALVSYAGRTYRCRQAHTSLTGWEPPNVPALWLPVST